MLRYAQALDLLDLRLNFGVDILENLELFFGHLSMASSFRFKGGKFCFRLFTFFVKFVELGMNVLDTTFVPGG